MKLLVMWLVAGLAVAASISKIVLLARPVDNWIVLAGLLAFTLVQCVAALFLYSVRDNELDHAPGDELRRLKRCVSCSRDPYTGKNV